MEAVSEAHHEQDPLTEEGPVPAAEELEEGVEAVLEAHRGEGPEGPTQRLERGWRRGWP